MRLLLVAPSLSEGGAARVLATLANAWAARGHEVTVVTLSDAAGDGFALADEVDRIGLAVSEASANVLVGAIRNVLRVRALRSVIRRLTPDVAIAFLHRTSVLVLLAALGTAVPVVVSERVDPRHDPLSRSWSLLRRLLYPRAAALVVQTERIADWARKWLSPDRVHVLPNPVVVPGGGEVTTGEGGGSADAMPGGADQDLAVVSVPTPRAVVGMGRLVRQKGFDRLVEAFARCAADHPDWSLVILGDGPERDRLQRLAESYDIAGRVQLPGHIRSPWLRLETADLFVLSSRYEGFPNVLLEAMARGVACVSFDCPTGPAEIVRHDVDGLLVPEGDVSGLAEAMGRLMSDGAMRRKLGQRARIVAERFGVERVVSRWDDVLRGITSES